MDILDKIARIAVIANCFDSVYYSKAFTNMLILLGKMRETAGHPLSYVPRSNLKGPNNADIVDETEDPRLWPPSELLLFN
jgi:hypothetical protein